MLSNSVIGSRLVAREFDGGVIVVVKEMEVVVGCGWTGRDDAISEGGFMTDEAASGAAVCATTCVVLVDCSSELDSKVKGRNKIDLTGPSAVTSDSVGARIVADGEGI